MKTFTIHQAIRQHGRFIAVLAFLALAGFIYPIHSFAVDKEATSISSANVSMSLVTPPPPGGFRPGNQFQVLVSVTNVDNSTGAFRLDLLDYREPDNFLMSRPILFGRNAILREAEFSHGILLRTLTNSVPKKELYDVDAVLEIASESDAYTWLIDKRFRNGKLQESDVATLLLTLEFVIYAEDVVNKLNQTQAPYTLFVDYTNVDGVSGDTEDLDIPIDIVGYVSPTGSRVYTTTIKPSGLMAGEPYLMEIGVIKYAWSGPHYFSLDLYLNQGYTPFGINTFYSDVLPSTSPTHKNGGNYSHRTLSYHYGTMESAYEGKRTEDFVDEFDYYHPFMLTYQLASERFNVRSASENCFYNSETPYGTGCPLGSQYLYANTFNRLFIQGVATLELAGSDAALTGEVTFDFYDDCETGETAEEVCKSVDLTNSSFAYKNVVNESIAIAPFTVTKTVCETCFDEGDEGISN
jgi:hypothetical protein